MYADICFPKIVHALHQGYKKKLSIFFLNMNWYQWIVCKNKAVDQSRWITNILHFRCIFVNCCLSFRFLILWIRTRIHDPFHLTLHVHKAMFVTPNFYKSLTDYVEYFKLKMTQWGNSPYQQPAMATNNMCNTQPWCYKQIMVS